MRQYFRLAAATLGSVAVVLLGVGCGSDEEGTGTASVTTADVPQIDVELNDTSGPNGEKATPASDVQLTSKQKEELKAGDYTAALVWHVPGLFTDAATKGIKSRLKELGIEVVAETQAEGDPAKQQSDLETVLALHPDVIISIPLDPVSAAKPFRQAVQQGAKLVFLSNIPEGFKHGKDYVGIVSSDVRQMARREAQLLADHLGGEGKLGLITYDADFFITDQWDEIYRETIEKQFPGIEIVAEKGFTDPAKTEEVATAMLSENPDLDALWVTWSEPAEGALAAIRAQGREGEVALSTVGMTESLAVDLADEGSVFGVAVDLSSEVARTMADEAALAVLGQSAPAFATAGVVEVTPENVVEGWEEVYGFEAPKAVVEAAAG